MKKSILTIAAIAFLAINIKAQDNSNTKENKADDGTTFHFGVKAGANYSNVYDAKGEEFKADAKMGFAAGAFLSLPFGRYFGFQPEVLFSQKGFKATGSVLGSSYEFTRTTSYLDIPLLIQLKPSGNITLLAGPQYSYLMKQKDVFNNAILSGTQEQEFNNDNMRKNILSFLGGIDINLNQIVLSGRAGWDIQNNNGDGSTTTPRYKNVWYQATLGFRF